MAPKRRGSKVVGSVVKTKVVQETVEVTTAIVGDGDEADPEQHAPGALAVARPALDVSSSRVVHVEVTTPNSGDNAKQPITKTGRGRREKPTPPPAGPVPVPQSQETQYPNEEEQEDEEDAGDTSKKKKQRQLDQEAEKQPETPRVALERKTTEKTERQRGTAGGDGGRKKGRRRLGQASSGGDAGMGGVGGYKRYVWRVLKQVHPELGVSGHAMQVLDMFMADMFERLADEAARLSKATGRATLSSREVQSAVRLVLPGELGKHAIAEGTKAISKYMSYA